MNDLIKLEGKGFEWTSRDIAEWTGKEHKNIMRDIRDEIDVLVIGKMENFAKLNFELSSYKLDTNTKPYDMYKLTKIGIQQLCMRYDAVVRAKVNIKIEELNKPMSLLEIAQFSINKLIEQEKEIKQLDNRITAIESKQINSPYEFFSVVAYCNLKGIKCELKQANKWGKAASKLSKDLGVKMGNTPDPRFGQVNTYHIEILDNIIQSQEEY